MSRIITAAVVLPFLIASILIPWLLPLFVLLLAAAMVLALYEFYLLARRRDLQPDVVAGYLGAAALFTVFYFNEPDAGSDVMVQMIQLVLLVLTAATLIAATLRGVPFDKMIASTGATLLGVLYIALFGGHLLAVRTGFRQTLSAHLLSFFFLIIMGSDAGAFYAGRLFGRHKLAPTISPGKTWEGVGGGLVAALLLAWLSHYWFFRELPLLWALPLAAVLMIIGVLGDLTESALKRSAGAKDTAKTLPGHGGLLDRLDSLLLNAPVIYYFGRIYFR